MSPNVETVWIELRNGVSVEITVQAIDPALPVPHEQPIRRTPTPRELDEAAKLLAARKHLFTPPTP